MRTNRLRAPRAMAETQVRSTTPGFPFLTTPKSRITTQIRASQVPIGTSAPSRVFWRLFVLVFFDEVLALLWLRAEALPHRAPEDRVERSFPTRLSVQGVGLDALKRHRRNRNVARALVEQPFEQREQFPETGVGVAAPDRAFQKRHFGGVEGDVR